MRHSLSFKRFQTFQVKNPFLLSSQAIRKSFMHAAGKMCDFYLSWNQSSPNFKCGLDVLTFHLTSKIYTKIEFN